MNLLKQAVLFTEGDTCKGCIFSPLTCEEERPESCFEGGVHFIFTEDGEL